MKCSLVLFDVNETLSDMGGMAQHFEEVGAPPGTAALWFASLLRDGFALTAAGVNPRFAELAGGSLRRVLAAEPLNRNLDDAVGQLLDAFQQLPVHSDVADGLAALARRGIRVAALTNGAAGTATSLLERAGLRGHFEEVLSVEDAPRWKPAASAYGYAAEACSTPLPDIALVAVHPWDIDGAARAGLRTVWLNRDGAAFPAYATAPDVTVRHCAEIAACLNP
ncbi:haloacid dehalogenase type II [Arthrobacter sp. Br18]|uniref:haloacid dehalogenase type II n=1 Tax=Arthrobacter sp. Br18 TaxID=1312954 RepID=UPI00047CBC18|nr:haloacid dehalogenase type II [Arthrobacter sp. Br18]